MSHFSHEAPSTPEAEHSINPNEVDPSAQLLQPVSEDSVALRGAKQSIAKFQEGRLTQKLEETEEKLAQDSVIYKNTARSILVHGRPKDEPVMMDKDDPGAEALRKTPAKQEEETADEYSARLEARRQAIISRIDRKVVMESIINKDVLVERPPDEDEKSGLVDPESKIKELYTSKRPVTRAQRRARRKHYKQKRQSLMRASSLVNLKATFGEERLDPTYDLGVEQLTKRERRTVEKGRRIQQRNITRIAKNKASIQATAKGEHKDLKKLEQQRAAIAAKLSQTEKRPKDAHIE